MYWKQPITTACLEFDTITRLVFAEIILHCRNKDMLAPQSFFHGNKRYTIQLKRGQCVFNIEKFCKETLIKKTRVKASLKIIEDLKNNENFDINIDINRKSFGLIITVQNYDDTVGIKNQSEHQSDFKVTSNEHQSDFKVTANNKNVNSANLDQPVEPDKHLESEKENSFKILFNEFWNLYPRKVDKKKTENIYSKLYKGSKDFESLHKTIMESVKSHSTNWLKGKKEFIPHPSTWLNGERWQDEIVENKRFEGEDISQYENLW